MSVKPSPPTPTGGKLSEWSGAKTPTVIFGVFLMRRRGVGLRLSRCSGLSCCVYCGLLSRWARVCSSPGVLGCAVVCCNVLQRVGVYWCSKSSSACTPVYISSHFTPSTPHPLTHIGLLRISFPVFLSFFLYICLFLSLFLVSSPVVPRPSYIYPSVSTPLSLPLSVSLSLSPSSCSFCSLFHKHTLSSPFLSRALPLFLSRSHSHSLSPFFLLSFSLTHTQTYAHTSVCVCV